jgi:ubiquinone biosynthesis protein COQ9
MAEIIGTSGAWKSTCLELNQLNFKPERPSEIFGFLETAKKEYALAKSNATQDIQNKIESLKKITDQLESSLEDDIHNCQAEIFAKIELVQLELQILEDGAGLIRKILNYSRVKKHKGKLLRLKNQYKNCPQVIQNKISLVQKALKETQKNSDSLVENNCKTIGYKVKFLQSIHSSPNLAGAIAELELIESLRTLPDNCYLISDVKLEANEAIYFDGEWLASAQIDHVVVAPSGIFVIEVKNWSKKFMQDGDYFDPYQQVKRARYLCYKLIGERYNLKTRSIIAHKGFVPKKPSDSHTKVLTIGKVKGYILWFKESNVNDQVVKDVVNLLAK